MTVHKPKHHGDGDPDRPDPQSGEPMIEFNVKAVDVNGAPITKPLVVRIDAGLSGTVRNTNPANFYNGPPLAQEWIGDIEITADGYAPWTTGAAPQVKFKDSTVNFQATLVPASFRRPPAIARGPLPPFVEPVNYRIELPWTPPPIPTRDYCRGDAWGVEMPGAPVVPGASPNKPERILSWFVDRYTSDFQKAYLEKYAGFGYSHFTLSYADSCGPVSMPPTAPPGNGRTLDQFIETCLFVKRYVKYNRIMIGSKYFQPGFMTAQQWADFADPIMDALIAAKAADEFVLGWEWNLWNTPGQVSVDAFRHCGQKARAAGLSSWMHYSPHYTSWPADGDSRGRFGFYDDLQGDVDGIDYQSMGPYWSPAMLQARIVDTLWVFGTRPDNLRLRLWEDFAAWMFDNDTVTVPVEDVTATRAFLEYDFEPSPRWGVPHRFRPRRPHGATPMPQDSTVTKTVNVTPEYANQRGYIGACTIDNVKGSDAKVWGYGNGGRMPDGSRL
jgi:hypothetical protein